GQGFPPTGNHMALTLDTSAAPPTGRGQENLFGTQGGQKGIPGGNLQFLLPIDRNGHRARRGQLFLGEQQQGHQQQQQDHKVNYCNDICTSDTYGYTHPYCFKSSYTL